MRSLNFHQRGVHWLERNADGWLLGLLARFTFLVVLLPYYLNSALTKPGEGLIGVLTPKAGAFAQILPPIAELYTYNVSAIPFFPWHLIVIAGTVSEFVLPILVVFGFLTRLSALAMIGFIVVQTAVDIVFHGTEAGAWLDKDPGQIVDLRLLWIFLLIYLVVQGAGRLSIDGLFSRRN